jgi:YVTN family beta-propeller protein
MNPTRLALVITAASIAAVVSPMRADQSKEPAGAGALIVLSKGDLTMSVVDPASLKVIGKVPSGPDPHEIVASSDGRMAYIANYNGGGNIITPVDLVAMKALTPIDLGPLRAPHGLDFAANKLWFTAEAAKVVASYDPATQKVDWVLGTGQNRTHMIYVWPDVSRMVTSNVSSASLTIVEKTTGSGRGRGGPQTDWNTTVVAVGRGAEGFDVSPDRKVIWAANAQDGTISIVDVESKKVTDTLAVNVNGANRLKFTPDGKYVFVSSLGRPEVAIFDAATKGDVKRLKTGGSGAAGIQMQPDGTRVYVACTPDNFVAIVDLKTLEVTGRIEAGRQPDGLAWVTRR